MITRLIVSLKKAANHKNSRWTGTGQTGSVGLARHTIGGSERGDAVALKNLSPEGGSCLS